MLVGNTTALTPRAQREAGQAVQAPAGIACCAAAGLTHLAPLSKTVNLCGLSCRFPQAAVSVCMAACPHLLLPLADSPD